MRIGIDARMIYMSGIGTYLRNLIGGLARLGGDHQYVLFLSKSGRERFGPPGENFRVVSSEAPPYSFAEQTSLACAIESQRLDLIHHPHYAAPLFGRVPMIATIHDLIHQLFPEECPSRLMWRISRAVARRTARRARLVLTVSENSRRDIAAHLGVPAAKVRLTYNALPPEWGRGDPPPPPAGLDAPYFLYVGNHKTHKNLPLLLEAFAGVRERAGRAGRAGGAGGASGVCLVLTGEKGDLADEIDRRCLEGAVVFLGDVPNDSLEGVYAAARALVFPSRYEGFGYPPLEAMGRGTPAIVSDAASLPEVVGEGGIVVPEGEAAPLRDAMLALLEDDSLRADLSRKALRQAERFSWRALAEGTLEAYREAAAQGERA
jgi:glycosyltransferase involved in cell wall biosynthesis